MTEQMPIPIELADGVRLFAADANGKRYPIKVYPVDELLDPQDVLEGKKKCETCKGAGSVLHECDCEFCSRNTETCDDCNGDGKVPIGAKQKRPKIILAGIFGEVWHGVPIIVSFARGKVSSDYSIVDRIKESGWKNCQLESPQESA